jgi:hypothetical protein
VFHDRGEQTDTAMLKNKVDRELLGHRLPPYLAKIRGDRQLFPVTCLLPQPSEGAGSCDLDFAALRWLTHAGGPVGRCPQPEIVLLPMVVPTFLTRLASRSPCQFEAGLLSYDDVPLPEQPVSLKRLSRPDIRASHRTR